jgi:hypothetical protein
VNNCTIEKKQKRGLAPGHPLSGGASTNEDADHSIVGISVYVSMGGAYRCPMQEVGMLYLDVVPKYRMAMHNNDGETDSRDRAEMDTVPPVSGDFPLT